MNLLGGLQQDAAAVLAGSAFFTDAGAPNPRPIPVVIEQLFNVQFRIQQALGQVGIITTLLTVSGRSSNKNRVRPYFEDIQVVARTQENVRVNRAPTGTGQSASIVAEASALLLHGHVPSGLGAAMFCTDLILVPDKTLLVFDAVFTLQAGMTDAAPVRNPWPPPPGS